MTMISRPQGPTNVNATAMNDAPAPTASSAEPADVMPAPEFVSGGDPIAVIAKLFVKSSQQKRANDDLSAKSQEHAEDAADAKRIEAMKTKADHTLVAGMVGGFSQVGSGACSLVGGVRAASALNGGGAELLRAETAKAVSSKWEAGAGVTGGLGKVGEAGFKSLADSADRDIVRAETEGKVAKRAQDALRKEVDAAAQHEGKVTQLLQEIKQAQAQCERAALLRMA